VPRQVLEEEKAGEKNEESGGRAGEKNEESGGRTGK
jgi:hypothetical protein